MVLLTSEDSGHPRVSLTRLPRKGRSLLAHCRGLVRGAVGLPSVALQFGLEADSRLLGLPVRGEVVGPLVSGQLKFLLDDGVVVLEGGKRLRDFRLQVVLAEI